MARGQIRIQRIGSSGRFAGVCTVGVALCFLLVEPTRTAATVRFVLVALAHFIRQVST
jgi:hypothetical protein